MAIIRNVVIVGIDGTGVDQKKLSSVRAEMKAEGWFGKGSTPNITFHSPDETAKEIISGYDVTRNKSIDASHLVFLLCDNVNENTAKGIKRLCGSKLPEESRASYYDGYSPVDIAELSDEDIRDWVQTGDAPDSNDDVDPLADILDDDQDDDAEPEPTEDIEPTEIDDAPNSIDFGLEDEDDDDDDQILPDDELEPPQGELSDDETAQVGRGDVDDIQFDDDDEEEESSSDSQVEDDEFGDSDQEIIDADDEFDFPDEIDVDNVPFADEVDSPDEDGLDESDEESDQKLSEAPQSDSSASNVDEFDDDEEELDEELDDFEEFTPPNGINELDVDDDEDTSASRSQKGTKQTPEPKPKPKPKSPSKPVRPKPRPTQNKNNGSSGSRQNQDDEPKLNFNSSSQRKRKAQEPEPKPEPEPDFEFEDDDDEIEEIEHSPMDQFASYSEEDRDNDEANDIIASLNRNENERRRREGLPLNDDDDGRRDYLPEINSVNDIVPKHPIDDAPYMKNLSIEDRKRQRYQYDMNRTYGVVSQRRNIGKVFSITGTNGGTGKTTWSWLFAESISHMVRLAAGDEGVDPKVWYIEADYRNPKLQQRFGLERSLGDVVNFILDNKKRKTLSTDEVKKAIADVSSKDEQTGIRLLTCPYDTQNARSRGLLKYVLGIAVRMASESGDYVIIDGQNFTSDEFDTIDSEILQKLSDQVVVVSSPHNIKELQRTIKEIRTGGATGTRRERSTISVFLNKSSYDQQVEVGDIIAPIEIKGGCKTIDELEPDKSLGYDQGWVQNVKGEVRRYMVWVAATFMIKNGLTEFEQTLNQGNPTREITKDEGLFKRIMRSIIPR